MIFNASRQFQDVIDISSNLGLKKRGEISIFCFRGGGWGDLELLAEIFRGAVLTQVTTQNIKLTLCSCYTHPATYDNVKRRSLYL